MEDKSFLNAQDIAEYMDISVSKAYTIIRELNNELKKKGFITVAGKVSRKYFEERVYGVSE